MNKKISELSIFFLVTYGINYILGILLLRNAFLNPNLFMGEMVLLPASGVFLAKRYSHDDKIESIPSVIPGFCMFYGIIIIIKIITGINESRILLLGEYATIVVSIILLVRQTRGRNENKPFYKFELIHKDFVLFIVILTGKAFLDMLPYLKENNTMIFGLIGNVLMIAFIFIGSGIRVLGEEYGWRGYLQPIMQKKFGKRAGVILLGILWEFWHIPLWFTVYDLKLWEIPFRILLAISFSIFLGYVYMRTNNVWLCGLAHSAFDTMSHYGTQGVNVENNIGYHIIIVLFLILSLSLFILKKEYQNIKRTDKTISS
ncbi:MAG: CPBP family intramembrane metalloprotease [Faecalicatena sp.]|uniref:CPBP family intramembrane glutamic endopeptidase n=1 Tax=Faecalicatena sp. TaxID=2005360 RepID=UPI00258F791A|nr:CPBP family intramembrane glutamic endopeptidase [Faecalicatena sp.]MCI6466251.1 CPBP family intramembrane metalloprotease [Faecalicatena sp.]MDY5620951.1 CPBP family intramembrane glutamic endopeptidase [Lachnospiraceae bacterium]